MTATSDMPISAANPVRRLDWVDAAKGVMIVLVVIGHDWRGLRAAGLVPDAVFVAVDSRIYAFHMPVFFALSGWFMAAALSRVSAQEFLWRRLTRLLWPMVLWTYLFLGTRVLAGQYANTRSAFEDLLILPFPGVLHLWFLWALVILSLVYGLLLHPFARSGRIATGVLIGAGILTLAVQFAELSPTMADWIGKAVEHAPFFFLGIVLGQSDLIDRLPRQARLASAGVFVLVLAVWPALARTDLAGVASLVLVVCVLVVSSGIGAVARGATARGLCWLGQASMAIYLAHTIFSAGIREALLAAGIASLPLHLVLGVLVGLIGPLILLIFSRRTGTARVLGF